MRRFPEDAADSVRVTETEVEWMVNEGERAGAIAGEKKKVHQIRVESCTKCGSCREVCPTKSIQVQ